MHTTSTAQSRPRLTHPPTTNTPFVSVPALLLQPGSSTPQQQPEQSLLARDAQYVQLRNRCGEPVGSPSKQQFKQAFAHVCLTFPLLFQNKVLKQQGKGLVNGSTSIPRNHQPRCFQLCSHCCNQWKHLAVMSTYWQEKKTSHPLCHGCISFQTNQ